MENTYENVSTDTGDQVIGSDGKSAEWTWLPLQWPWWVILQLLFSLLGVIGNLLVLMVLFLRRKMRRSTDTLISALAFADFMTSVFLIPHPQILTLPSDSWLGQLYCRIINPSFILWISVVASVFILTAISIERYVAIAHPFTFKRLFTRTRTTLYIGMIWTASLVTNSFQLIVGFAANNTCVVAFPSVSAQKVIGVFVFLVEFVLPATTMITAQAMTAYALHKQSKSFAEGNVGQDRSNPTMNHIIARKRVLQMLVMVVTVFIVCWGPDQTFFLGFNLGLIDPSLLYGPVYRALVVLAFMNSCANAIIYTIRYPLFRQAIKDMFLRNRASRKPIFEVDLDSQSK